MKELAIIPLWVWGMLGVILLIQGTWVFNDSSKRGMNKWLWGLFGLLNTPTNLIVYLIVSRTVLGTKKCPSCGVKHNKVYKYCPYCGVATTEE